MVSRSVRESGTGIFVRASVMYKSSPEAIETPFEGRRRGLGELEGGGGRRTRLSWVQGRLDCCQCGLFRLLL